MTVNFSDEYKMKDWLKFGVQMNGAYMLPADAKNVTGAIHAAPISPIYDDATGGFHKLLVPEFADLQPDDRHRGVRRPQQGAELPLRGQCLRRDQFPARTEIPRRLRSTTCRTICGSSRLRNTNTIPIWGRSTPAATASRCRRRSPTRSMRSRTTSSPMRRPSPTSTT